MTILIKRYANRKLYNTDTSRYITLKGIAELIEQKQDIRVIDNETGEDITSVALSQILVDSERSGNQLPRNILSDLISRGGDALYGALKRSVEDASDGIGDIQRNVRRLVRRDEDELEQHPLGDWITFSKPDFEKLVQNAMERVLHVLDLPRRSEIDALNENLERVVEALERLERGDRAEDASTEPPGGATPVSNAGGEG